MSLGMASVIVTAIPSHAADSVLLVPALSTLSLSKAKTSCKFVELEIWPKEMLQVGRFLHLLGKISHVRQGRVLPPLPGELN